MKILIYIGHPAQFLFFKNFIKKEKQKGNEVIVLIKSKDVLEDLIKKEDIEYVNIVKTERKNSKLSIAFGLIKRIVKVLYHWRKNRPDILVGTDPSLAIVGYLTKTPCITTLEDDAAVIPKLVKTTYPYTNTILVPECCDVGSKWNSKKIGYAGYMKLAYLHQKYFKPNPAILQNLKSDKYVLVRLSKLSAHHDTDIKGVSNQLIDTLIKYTTDRSMDLYISSERELPSSLEKYRLTTPVSDIHHVLYYSSLLISDSQSMSVEASMLGTPSVRFSDFSGRISVLEELENKYHLTFGFKSTEQQEMLDKVLEILSMPEAKEEFRMRCEKMLDEKIDVTSFLMWFVEEYPNSRDIMLKDPSYQYRFK